MIQRIFVEPEFGDNCPTDPFEVSGMPPSVAEPRLAVEGWETRCPFATAVAVR